jgi:hypothetical protein
MPLLQRVGMLYGGSGDTPLRQEFHYKLIFTWLVRTRSLLPMWWLLTWHERRWLWMSLIDQKVQLRNLTPLLIFTSIEGFMKGINLFWWPWRCTTHLGMIWIISLGSVFIFFMMDDQEVIYLCFFSFNFSGCVLILLFSMI